MTHVENGTFLPIRVVQLDLNRPPTEQVDGSVVNAHGQVCVIALRDGVPVGRVLLRDLAPGIGADDLRAAVLEQVPCDTTDAPLRPATSPTTPVTVVVCSIGTEPRLRDAVQLVLDGSYEHTEVLVVDNAPGPDSGVRRILAGLQDPRLRIVDEPRRGLSVARNTGLRACTTPLIAYTDDDAVPERDWVRRLVEVFACDDTGRVACVTGLVVPAELDRPEHLWFEQTGGFDKGYRRQLWGPPPLLEQLAHLGRPGRQGALYPYFFGECGSGNNMAFRTEALLGLGGFDPALGAGTPARGGEDLDIYRAVLLSGQVVAYTSEAVVGHHHRDTYAALRSQMHGYGVGMGAVVTKGLIGISPSATMSILGRAVPALRVLLSPHSVKNAHKSDADPAGRFPPELERVELRGVLGSPWRYLRSRLRYRTAPRPGGSSGALEANAFALMFSSIATAVLGLAFWAATARGYPAVEVGKAAATISSATILSTLSNTSMGAMYERFLGVTRARTLPWIFRGQAMGVMLALLLGTGFLVLGPREKLFSSTAELVLFPVLVAVLAVFGLQDPILVGLRAAKKAAIKNVFHAVAKLVLVILLAFTVSGASIVYSWLVPALLAAVVVNVWLVRRGLRHHDLTSPAVLPPLRELWHFFGATYALTLMSSITPLLLPLLVVYRFGAETNAYFASSWALASAAALLIGTVGGPFIAEASAHPDLHSLPGLTRRFARMLILLGGGGGVALFVLAPFLLGLFGEDYVREGLHLTRLMACSLPLVAVGAMFGALSRVYRRMKLVVVLQPITIIGVVTGAFWLTSTPLGVDGIGVAYLCTEVFVAIVVAVPLVRLYRRAVNQQPIPHADGPSAVPVGADPAGPTT